MESNDHFGNYPLSTSTLDKLQRIDEILRRHESTTNSTWATVAREREQRFAKDDPPENMEIETCTEVEKSIEAGRENSPIASTQFFLSQTEKPHRSPSHVKSINSGWIDVAECLYESLENSAETPLVADLKNLSDTEVDSVVKYLSTKLTLQGTYNLCDCLCTTDSDRNSAYTKIICGNLLLQKMIDLSEPCRLMNSLIHKLVEKFPEDIREFLYIPMLNAQLKDASAISAIIGTFPPQRKMDLLTSFQASVGELQEWHLIVLSQLIITKITDNVLKEKLLDLLSEKASTWSRDKNYGKFFLFFIKLNSPFTGDQKNVISEIISFNETMFKRIMESLVNNMYFHDGLWHVS